MSNKLRVFSSRKRTPSGESRGTRQIKRSVSEIAILFVVFPFSDRKNYVTDLNPSPPQLCFEIVCIFRRKRSIVSFCWASAVFGIKTINAPEKRKCHEIYLFQLKIFTVVWFCHCKNRAMRSHERNNQKWLSDPCKKFQCTSAWALLAGFHFIDVFLLRSYSKLFRH